MQCQVSPIQTGAFAKALILQYMAGALKHCICRTLYNMTTALSILLLHWTLNIEFGSDNVTAEFMRIEKINWEVDQYMPNDVVNKYVYGTAQDSQDTSPRKIILLTTRL